MNKIYMDYNAATKPCKEVVDILPELANEFYNASSSNELSLKNKARIEAVRNVIKKYINADDEDDVVFVSSASEGNSLAIDGFLKANNKDNYRVVASAIEHDSILQNPNITDIVYPDSKGRINPKEFNEYKKSLCCVMHSNNEIGTLEPIKEISNIVHKNNGYILCDASSSIGKVDIDVKDLNVDMLTFSGYKIGSLKGVGVLYIKKGVKISSIIYGHQENNLRGGTLNEMAIISLGIAIKNLKDYSPTVSSLRAKLIMELMKFENITINGDYFNSIPNTVNITIHDVSIGNQQIVSILDSVYGFIISSGSACNSGVPSPSHVLKAIGLSDEEANSSIRISLGMNNTEEEVEILINALKTIISMNKKIKYRKRN